MRWQCSLYAQLLPGFAFLSPHSDVSPRSRWSSLAERGQALYRSHYLHSVLLCAWQHNYQSRGPVQLIAGDLLTARARVERTRQGWDRISTKVLLERSCPGVSTPLTGVHGGWWTSGKVLPSQWDKMTRWTRCSWNTTNVFSLACVERRAGGKAARSALWGNPKRFSLMFVFIKVEKEVKRFGCLLCYSFLSPQDLKAGLKDLSQMVKPRGELMGELMMHSGAPH